MTAKAPRVAYIMSRFPKLTETFVLDEMLAMQSQGVTVEVFPLWRESARLMHAEASAMVSRAHFLPTLNTTIVAANFFWLRRHPQIYLATLFVLIRANWRSMRFLLGALAVFPKACSFARKMRALGVDHVHAHFASHPAAAAYVIGRLAEIPWSFTAHGSDLHREQAMLREKVEAADFVIAISEYNRRFIIERVGTACADKVRKLHCGVERSRFTRTPTQAPQAEGNDAPGIICIGTLHAVKGQKFLLLACGRLRSLGYRFRCHLVGDGEDRRALETLAEDLKIANDVVFHGAIERERVQEVLSSVQIAAAPSVPTADGRREGIPVALMEAAACGLPLVASRLSGIPELVRDEETGLLVDAFDDAALAQALARLLEKPQERQRLGDAARELLSMSFDLQRNVASLRSMMFAPDCA